MATETTTPCNDLYPYGQRVFRTAATARQQCYVTAFVDITIAYRRAVLFAFRFRSMFCDTNSASFMRNMRPNNKYPASWSSGERVLQTIQTQLLRCCKTTRNRCEGKPSCTEICPIKVILKKTFFQRKSFNNKERFATKKRRWFCLQSLFFIFKTGFSPTNDDTTYQWVSCCLFHTV